MQGRFLRILLGLMMAAAISLVPVAAEAFSSRSGDTVTLPKNETHRGTLYAAGKNITIDGVVDGDLVCAGSTVTVNGAVAGDILCAAQVITVNGRVGGNTRVAGQTVNLNSETVRNATVFAQILSVGSAAKIDGELAVFAETANVDGAVGRELHGFVSVLTLNGPVAGTVHVTVDRLVVGAAAAVGGNLFYTSERTFPVDDAKVTGDIKRNAPVNNERNESPRQEFLDWLASRAFWILASLAIILPLIWVAPRLVERVTAKMRSQPGPSLGWGALIVLAGPLALILLSLTLIGIPLAVILGGVWLLALFTGRLVAAVVFGRWLLARGESPRQTLTWAALAGIPLAIIIYGVPGFGFILSLMATWWAVGAMALVLRDWRR